MLQTPAVEIRWVEVRCTEIATAPYVEIERPDGRDSPADVACLLSIDGVPTVCARLWRNFDEVYAFRDAVYWRGHFVIGWGNAFYTIDPQAHAVTRHDLGAYFGSIYAQDVLLIASGERVVRLDEDGTIAWSSDRVAIDGVIISDVDSEFIQGAGEWDPPGGWEPFRLDLKTGILISGGKPESM